MKILYCLAFGLFIISSSALQAQVAEYGFSSSPGSYAAITTGDSLGSAVTTVQTFPGKSIGFTFNYNGIDYTTMTICANGYIILGNNSIDAFCAGIEGIQISKLSYSTFDDGSGKKVCVIQWSKFKRVGNTYYGDSYDFQIRFHETSNVIEVVYGTMTNTPSTPQNLKGTAKVGLFGPNASDYNKRKTSSDSSKADWTKTTADSTGTGTCLLYKDATLSVAPPSGLTFVWAPSNKPMTYVSSTVTQIAGTLNLDTRNNKIIGVQVVASGITSPLKLTSLTILPTGSTNFSNDVSKIKVYYTGAKSTFDTTSLFGSADDLSSPITGNDVTLLGGKNINYFWVTYEISWYAHDGDSVDAECVAITLKDSGTKTPTITNPAGKGVVSAGWWYKTTYKSSMSNDRGNIYSTTFTIGGKAYVGTGRNMSTNSNINEVADIYEYDAGTNIFTRKADFGGGTRHSAIAFSIGKKGYLGLGIYFLSGNYSASGQNFNQDFWEYNVDSNKWRQLSNFPGGKRASSIAFSINGKGYVGMGVDSAVSTPQTIHSDFYEYDTVNNSWRPRASFPIKVSGATAFVIDGKGYVCGGLDAALNTYSNRLYEYDPVADTWTQKDTIPISRGIYGASSFVIGGKGYVGTGITKNASGTAITTGSFFEYNPQRDTSWKILSDYSRGASYGTVGFAIGNKGFIGLGLTPNALNLDYCDQLFGYTPKPTISIDATVSKSTPCPGDTVIFTPIINDTQLSWNWSFPGGTPSSSTDQNPHIVYTTPGQYDVTLFVTTAHGTVALTKQKMITVENSPTAIITTDMPSACSTPLSATSSQSGSGTIVGYQWYLNGTAIAGAAASTYDAGRGGSYRVVVTNSFGCSSSSDTVHVDEGAKPTAIVSGDTVSCDNGSVTLSSVLSIPGKGSITGHQWLKDGVAISGAASVTYQIPDNSSGMYRVVVTNTDGCSDTSAIHPVVFSTRPFVHLGTDVNTCDTTVLDAGSGAQYLWSTGETTQKIKVSKTGDYSVTVTNAVGCSGSDTIQVTYKGLSATITVPDTAVVNKDVAFHSTAAGATTWHWSFGNGGTSQKQDTTYRYTKTGEDTVTLIVSNGTCSDTVRKVIVVIAPNAVREDQVGEIGVFNVYPNPTDGKCILDVKLQSPGNMKVRVTNILGVTMYEENVGKVMAVKKELNLRGYAQGVYQISIVTSTENMVKKIFIR